MAQDVVCDMEVTETSTAPKREYQGTTYYFCCEGCAKTFEKDPGQYVKA